MTQKALSGAVCPRLFEAVQRHSQQHPRQHYQGQDLPAVRRRRTARTAVARGPGGHRDCPRVRSSTTSSRAV